MNGPIDENCIWEIETQRGKILAFTLVEGNLEEALEYFTVGLIKFDPTTFIRELVYRRLFLFLTFYCWLADLRWI